MRNCVPLFVLLSLASCSAEPAPAASPDPWTRGGIVSAANPYAAEAAAEILRMGGHAVDAAVAAHAVLGLVEPQSSGLGGGAFMLVYARSGDELVAYDGRETAPAGAHAQMFLEDGEPIGFVEAWQSGLSVGVPGMVALYAASHRDFGRLEMAEVLAPAIELAREGFVVSPRLAGFLEPLRSVSRLDDNPATAAYFYPEGQALTAGIVRTNPAYAETLARVAREGPKAFYEGEIAQQIVAAVQAGPRPGSMTLEDLAGYQVIRREPVCGGAGPQTVCTMPPPSSGLTQIMILNLYDLLMAKVEDGPAVREAAFVDAQRLAYADRDHYVADPDFVHVPVSDLIDPAYLEARARQRFAPQETPAPGDPGAVLRNEPIIDRWGRDTTDPASSTTHLSIVDMDGNAVSLTASVEGPFGSSRWAAGFLLNNELTDFARQPRAGGERVANTAAPGKRPRSSMSPVLVFDEGGELLMATGSPGGNSIIAYVAKSLLGVLRWGLAPQAAVDHPNVIARGPTVRLETHREGGAALKALLTDLGYPVEEMGRRETSGLHVVVAGDQGLEGAADPRREGEVIAVSASD